MSKETKLYTILIASPGDVAEEREIVRQEAYRWNSMHAIQTNMILHPIGWETDATPDLRERGQAVINRQLVDDCDLLIGIFWTRLGTPTKEADSGTAEEIERAINKGKRCMIYFSDKVFPPSELNAEQYEKLNAYKKKLNEQGLTDSYKQIEEFQEKVFRHITKAVQEIAQEEKKSKAAEKEALLTEKALGVTSPENLFKPKQDISFDTLVHTNNSIRLLLESQFGIQDIEDLKEQNISRINSSLESPELALLFSKQPSIETIPTITKIIEDITTSSLYIVSALGRYGDDFEDDLLEIIGDWIARLSTRKIGDYDWVSFIKTYPGLLLLYALGISAVRSGKLNLLSEVVDRRVQIRTNMDETYLLDAIDPRYVFYYDVIKLIEPGFDRRFTPVSDHLGILIKRILYAQEEEERFFDWFDLFELLMALKSVQQKDDRPYIGSFTWRNETKRFWIKKIQDAAIQKGKYGKRILDFFGSQDEFEVLTVKFDSIADKYQNDFKRAAPPSYVNRIVKLAKKGIIVSSVKEILNAELD